MVSSLPQVLLYNAFKNSLAFAEIYSSVSQTHVEDNVHLSQIQCVTVILYRNIMFYKVILHLNCNNEVLKKKKQLQICTTLNSLREP